MIRDSLTNEFKCAILNIRIIFEFKLYIVISIKIKDILMDLFTKKLQTQYFSDSILFKNVLKVRGFNDYDQINTVNDQIGKIAEFKRSNTK